MAASFHDDPGHRPCTAAHAEGVGRRVQDPADEPVISMRGPARALEGVTDVRDDDIAAVDLADLEHQGSLSGVKDRRHRVIGHEPGLQDQTLDAHAERECHRDSDDGA